MAEIAFPFLNNFSLHGKNALISGSSSGLGLAMGMAFAKSGANVILNGRNKSTLIRLKQQASLYVSLHIHIICDVHRLAPRYGLHRRWYFR